MEKLEQVTWGQAIRAVENRKAFLQHFLELGISPWLKLLRLMDNEL